MILNSHFWLCQFQPKLTTATKNKLNLQYFSPKIRCFKLNFYIVKTKWQFFIVVKVA